MIQDHPDPEDAFVEYASILVLEGDVAAYRKWSARVAEKFKMTKGPFVGTMLVRACGLSTEPTAEHARLVSWAEQAVAKLPKAPSSLHSLGLALLRSGQPEKALTQFQASIDTGEDSARNWYGLALAHSRLGRLEEAGRWIDKADSWMVRKKSEFADRKEHLSPPIYIADWLETEILRREADSLIADRRLGNVVLIDRNAAAGCEYRLPLGTIDLRRDPLRDSPAGSLVLAVPFRKVSPLADGSSRPNEYGAPLAIDFTGDVNPGRLFQGSKAVTDPRDFSARLYVAYTKDDLFVAVRVQDDQIAISPTQFLPHGDLVEIFVDGDRQSNDFDKPSPGNEKANREGFHVGADASGRRFSNGIRPGDYAVGVAKCEGGYVVEFRIPLDTIDTNDGAEVSPAGPGSTLRFNLAIADNDEVAQRQDRYGFLWGNDTNSSPYPQGEPGWLVDLHLARPVKYELLAGPKGATLDPETGVFRWNTPKEPQAAKVKVRVQDVEKPELSAFASFTITTTAK